MKQIRKHDIVVCYGRIKEDKQCIGCCNALPHEKTNSSFRKIYCYKPVKVKIFVGGK